MKGEEEEKEKEEAHKQYQEDASDKQQLLMYNKCEPILKRNVFIVFIESSNH